MSSTPPVVIADSNLSRVWSRVLLHVIDRPGTEVSPLVVSISGFEAPDVIPEVDGVRDALDKMLRAEGAFEVGTVANTIFPQSVWRISGGDRQALYDEYLAALPRYAAIEKLNKAGTYFSRLIAFDTDAKTGERFPHLEAGDTPENGNQLEFVIKHLAAGKVRRRAAFQISIFDPTRDHSALPYKVFPCMQHLTFLRSDDEKLVVNAFYATQLIERKAYGNFLGICRLGHFVAGQTNLELDRVNVFVGCEKMDLTKGSAALRPVIRAARACVAEFDDQDETER